MLSFPTAGRGDGRRRATRCLVPRCGRGPRPTERCERSEPWRAITLGARPGARFRARITTSGPAGVQGQAIDINKTSFIGDKPVNRIGFGAMQLAGPGVFGPPRDPDGARAVLRRAIELGVDHIDTAQYYGPDVVNELIRESLHPYPENLKLVTKVGARRDAAGGIFPAQRPEELREGVEENRPSLRVEGF